MTPYIDMVFHLCISAVAVWALVERFHRGLQKETDQRSRDIFGIYNSIERQTPMTYHTNLSERVAFLEKKAKVSE